jgi:hypothetical protein
MGDIAERLGVDIASIRASLSSLSEIPLESMEELQEELADLAQNLALTFFRGKVARYGVAWIKEPETETFYWESQPMTGKEAMSALGILGLILEELASRLSRVQLPATG